MLAAPSDAEIFGALAGVLGARAGARPSTIGVEPSAAWASSGALSLTGPAERPLVAPDRVTLGLFAIAQRIGALSGAIGRRVEANPLAVIGERAALRGLIRGGTTSCGGQARLMPTRDGWIAVSLAREEDRNAVGAWLDVPGHPSDWDTLAATVTHRDAAGLIARARLLGMPVGHLDAVGPGTSPAVLARRVGGSSPSAPALADAVVIDLSSLWAGPLAARLLADAGARVIKVESRTRPDGGRRGDPRFFDLLHAGKESVLLDFATPTGRRQLRDLVMGADIVIEASRPRALRQLGIHAEEALETGRVQTWLSLTAHGARGAEAEWVGFGDDAAVAGGLAARDGEGPCFCADAIADPATGLVAAAAVLAAHGAGRWHLDVALSRVAAVLGGQAAREPWRPGDRLAAPRPAMPPDRGAARAAGADTDPILKQMGGSSR